MNLGENEFSELLKYLESDQISIVEERKQTRCGVLYIGNLILNCETYSFKKAEIVSLQKSVGKPLIFKLESILSANNSHPRIINFSIQIFDDGFKGLNYGGRIVTNSKLDRDLFYRISRNFFNDFRENSTQIYSELHRLVENNNPNSKLLNKLELVQKISLPNKDPRISQFNWT